jgi:hypothetical protein
MELYYVKNNILIGSLVLAVIAGACSYRKLDIGLRLFWLLNCSSLLSETLAYFSALRFMHNVGIYAVSSIVGAFVSCLYFNFSVAILRKYHIGIIAGVISILIGVVLNFFIQSVRHFPSYFLHYQALLIIAMSMFALTRMLQTYDYFDVWREPHFWICTHLIFFWSTTYFFWTLFEYYTVRLHKQHMYIALCMFLVNFICNTAAAIIFFLAPKMRTYER